MTSPCADHEHLGLPRQTVEPAILSAAASYFRAMGEPGRLATLLALRAGEACVSELAETLSVELPALSQRLRVLRQAGLVRSRREGRHIFYALHDDHVAHLIDNALAHAHEPKEASP